MHKSFIHAMEIYINDTLVRITTKHDVPKTDFNVLLIRENEEIKVTELEGSVLVVSKSNEVIEQLLKDMTLEKHGKIRKVEIQVSDKQKVIEHLKSKFDIVKAAGGVVGKGNKILMILRNDVWDIPKGKLELGEDKQEGALREVEEETGVLVKAGVEVCSTWHTYILKDKYVLKKTYWYKMACLDDAQMKPQKEENIQKVIWMNHEEVTSALLNSYKTIAYVIRKYREFL